MNLNHVQLAGRLTRDPEIRYTPAGVAITDIGIAVNRFSKDDQGETKESTDFIDVTAFGKTAEIIQEHLHKGSPVYVEGRLKLDQWDDRQTGAKRSKLKVVAESMQFVGPRQTEAASNQSPQRQAPPARATASAGKSQPEPDWPEDSPF